MPKRSGQFAGHCLIVAHDPVRAAEQGDKRRTRIAALKAMAEKMVTNSIHRSSDQIAQRQILRGRIWVRTGEPHRGVVVPIAGPIVVSPAPSPRPKFRFSWRIDEDAVADAQLFDGKLVLIPNGPDLTPAEPVERYRSLADIARGFRVKSINHLRDKLVNLGAQTPIPATQTGNHRSARWGSLNWITRKMLEKWHSNRFSATPTRHRWRARRTAGLDRGTDDSQARPHA